MEFELLIENGELTISESELNYLAESLELTEDEIMEFLAESTEDIDLDEEDYARGSVNLFIEEDGEVKKSLFQKGKEKVKETYEKNKERVQGAIEKGKEKGKEKVNKAADWAKEHPGKATAIAAGTIVGATALGAAGASALKKRKAKKD